MPGLLGKKIGMTSVFSADGKNVPCTVIEAGPCVVTQIKSVEKDGYAAVQVGFQDKKEKHTTKPLMGHFKKAGPGSIGACSYPAKVFKGMRMGGQMGGDRVTTHNLQVLKVIPEHNLLLIKGSVPGCKGSIVIIEK